MKSKELYMAETLRERRDAAMMASLHTLFNILSSYHEGGHHFSLAEERLALQEAQRIIDDTLSFSK